MTTVTKIEVTYGRTVQPKEYESKRAEATIGVQLEEGETDIGIELDEAMAHARDVVHLHLGIGAANPSAKPAPITKPLDRDDLGDDAPEVDTRTRGQKAADTRAKNKAAKEAAEAAEAATDDDDITQEDIDAHGVEDVTTRSPEPDYDDDEIDFDMDAPVSEEVVTEEPVEEHDEITDAELSTEINIVARAMKKNGREDGVKVIKAAIAAFNTDNVENFTAASLTQGQRRKFLPKLAAINTEAKA
jgi:hypothetical protein